MVVDCTNRILRDAGWLDYSSLFKTLVIKFSITINMIKFVIKYFHRKSCKMCSNSFITCYQMFLYLKIRKNNTLYEFIISIDIQKSSLTLVSSNIPINNEILFFFVKR
jgi:hypothetical protein